MNKKKYLKIDTQPNKTHILTIEKSRSSYFKQEQTQSLIESTYDTHRSLTPKTLPYFLL